MAKERGSDLICPLHLLLALSLNAEESTRDFLSEYGLTTERLFKVSLPVDSETTIDLQTGSDTTHNGFTPASVVLISRYLASTRKKELNGPSSQYLLFHLLEEEEIRTVLTELNIDVAAMMDTLKRLIHIEAEVQATDSRPTRDEILNEIRVWRHRSELAYSNGLPQLAEKAFQEVTRLENLLADYPEPEQNQNANANPNPKPE